MPIFAKSLEALCKERDDLQALIDTRALALTARNVETGYLVSQLVPLTTEMQRIKRAIRDRTPVDDLKARRDELQRRLEELPEVGVVAGVDRPLADMAADLSLRGQRMEMSSEIQEIDIYLQSASHRRPLDMKVLAAIVAIVLALLVLPDVIGRWLSP